MLWFTRAASWAAVINVLATALAFYAPILSDWRNYETWSEAGSPTAIERANRIWKERLATYEEPPMDPSIREELDAFVAKRRAEGGAPTDF